MINRRHFVKSSVAYGAGIAAFPSILTKSPDVMDRLGLTTVVFRDYFQSTSNNKGEIQKELSLLDIPEYFSARFKIRNIEFWSRHFESTSPVYLSDLGKKLRKNKCQLIDIQVDTKNDISDTIEENRQAAIIEMKEWIDVASILGSKYVRVSQMRKSYDNSVESLKMLLDYAVSKSVILLVENHFDMFSKLENQLNIVGDIEHENFGLLADFGNYPKDVMYQYLEKITPYVQLISAKTADFTTDWEHESFDFGRCIRIFENAGYKGIYSLEQWSKPKPYYDPEKITDWMIKIVKENIS